MQGIPAYAEHPSPCGSDQVIVSWHTPEAPAPAPAPAPAVPAVLSDPDSEAASHPASARMLMNQTPNQPSFPAFFMVSFPRINAIVWSVTQDGQGAEGIALPEPDERLSSVFRLTPPPEGIDSEAGDIVRMRAEEKEQRR